MNSTNRCSYHHDRSSVISCASCKANICGSDLKYQRKVSKHPNAPFIVRKYSGRHGTSYQQKIPLCLPCYLEKAVTKRSIGGPFCWTIIIGGIFFYIFRYFSQDPRFTLGPLIVLIGILVMCLTPDWIYAYQVIERHSVKSRVKKLYFTSPDEVKAIIEQRLSPSTLLKIR